MGETAEYSVIGGSFSSKHNDFLNLSKLDLIIMVDANKYGSVLNVFHVGCLLNKTEVNLNVSAINNLKGSSR